MTRAAETIADRDFVILDFFAVTDPTALLTALVAFKGAGRSVGVLTYNVKQILFQVGGPDPDNDPCFDLTSKGQIDALEGFYGTTKPELNPSNVMLALRLLHHGLSTGIIELLKDGPVAPRELITEVSKRGGKFASVSYERSERGVQELGRTNTRLWDFA